MRRSLLLVPVAALASCVPWNQVHGPTAGAAVVYRTDRGFSPQVSVGYAGERFRSWYGYGADARVSVEPWRRRVGASAMLRGSLLFWELGVGPALEWEAGEAQLGLTISAGARITLGARSTCTGQTNPNGCLDERDTVYPDYLPRVHYQATLLSAEEVAMAFGGDLIVSAYWLRHRETRPPTDH